MRGGLVIGGVGHLDGDAIGGRIDDEERERTIVESGRHHDSSSELRIWHRGPETAEVVAVGHDRGASRRRRDVVGPWLGERTGEDERPVDDPGKQRRAQLVAAVFGDGHRRHER